MEANSEEQLARAVRELWAVPREHIVQEDEDDIDFPSGSAAPAHDAGDQHARLVQHRGGYVPPRLSGGCPHELCPPAARRARLPASRTHPTLAAVAVGTLLVGAVLAFVLGFGPHGSSGLAPAPSATANGERATPAAALRDPSRSNRSVAEGQDEEEGTGARVDGGASSRGRDAALENQTEESGGVENWTSANTSLPQAACHTAEPGEACYDAVLEQLRSLHPPSRLRRNDALAPNFEFEQQCLRRKHPELCPFAPCVSGADTEAPDAAEPGGEPPSSSSSANASAATAVAAGGGANAAAANETTGPASSGNTSQIATNLTESPIESTTGAPRSGPATNRSTAGAATEEDVDEKPVEDVLQTSEEPNVTAPGLAVTTTTAVDAAELNAVVRQGACVGGCPPPLATNASSVSAATVNSSEEVATS
jgi:hypothetical protein